VHQGVYHAFWRIFNADNVTLERAASQDGFARCENTTKTLLALNPFGPFPGEAPTLTAEQMRLNKKLRGYSDQFLHLDL
jgi:hypothetical protein